ncbi:MAG: hypothetical protein WDN03_15190 [Rhizomicrobium sp.]
MQQADHAVHADAHLHPVPHLLAAEMWAGRLAVARAAADVAARAEAAARTGQDQAAQSVIVEIFVQRIDDLVAHRIGVSVQAVGPVQRELRDGGLDRLEQDGAIVHGVLPMFAHRTTRPVYAQAMRAISNTAMLALVQGFRAAELDKALADNPGLTDVRDDRGRNWLHICCSRKPATGQEKGQHPDRRDPAAARLRPERAGLHRRCLGRHAGVVRHRPRRKPAARRIPPEARRRPNHALWAASFRSDIAAIRLLVKHGARLEDVAEDTTPFLAP